MTNQTNGMLKGIVNSALKDLGHNLSLDELLSTREELTDQITNQTNITKRLRDEINQIKKNAKTAVYNSGGSIDTHEMGSYRIVTKKVSEVFPEIQSSELIDCFEWDKPNPRVPEPSVDFIPNWNAIIPLIDGLVNDLNSWFYGPTGCGKDASINFIAARIGMPVVNISFDADISRAELVGRDKLEVDKKSGATYSEFMEGLLPFAMRHPCILALDEIDFVREDVAYVMQTLLNENRLAILEKKGELIEKHPKCKIIATANTNGQQDEMNNYNGSRQQSGAFLDRFNNWVRGDYLSAKQYALMFSERLGLTVNDFDKHASFIKAYQECQENGDVKTALSNRTVSTIADRMDDPAEFMDALTNTFLNRLTKWEHDKAIELCTKHGLR